MQAERVLIVGGGMAGLSLANALSQRGVPAEVVERSEEADGRGTGQYLVGVATRALGTLGVAEAARELGQVIRTQTFVDSGGAQLAEIDVEAYWADQGFCLGIEHATLHRLLLERVVPGSVRFGVTVQALHQEHDRVLVNFSDGTEGTYSLVVGADGIRSTVRSLVLPAAEPRFRGQVGWRFVTACPPEIAGWTVYLGGSGAFLLVPVGGGRVYCYADKMVAQPEDDPAEGRLERLRELFSAYPSPVPELLNTVDASTPVHYAAVEEVALDAWGRGRVLLIGDAAHAMSPNMACGCAMAFEDALVLADQIEHTGIHIGIAAAFRHRRAPRVDWLRKQTNQRDRLRNFPQAIRNALLRRLAERTYRANYQPLLAIP